MKPKIIHQQAMDYSFKANKAFENGEFEFAIKLYKEAAMLESQVAEFYFDKPEVEPTRSIIIRSAAFLNLKAGLVDEAQKFIFFGLLNTKDESIKIQLRNALEISVSLSGMNSEEASKENYYLTVLRQRSQNYILEPALPTYGHSVSLEMIKDFSDGYLKSLKAYALSKFREIVNLKKNINTTINKEIDNIINPLVTNSAYGSFKFSIANDFLERPGEDKRLIKIKSQIISNYHTEIFSNPLSEGDIKRIKHKYSEDDVNSIFRPLTKIKSQNTPYKIGYYDMNTFDKVYVSKIANGQRKQLLTIREISKEDIGELESSLVHKRSAKGGRTSKQVIFKEQMKTAEFDIKISTISPKESKPILLAEEIIVNMSFDSNKGFTFSFSDLDIQNTDIVYQKALEGFHNNFYYRLKELADKRKDDFVNQKYFELAKRIVNNLNALAE